LFNKSLLESTITGLSLMDAIIGTKFETFAAGGGGNHVVVIVIGVMIDDCQKQRSVFGGIRHWAS
jgi:hypothetical protein